jgi:hypothetical protein
VGDTIEARALELLFGISGALTAIEHGHNEMAFPDGLRPKHNSNVDRLGCNWKN